jgi:hypothetical protein
VEDNANVSFWHNLWCGNKALKETFSDLFTIACAKYASIVAHLELSSGFQLVEC